MGDVPVSVVILTKNEARRIEDTLRCLDCFSDIWVVDSVSTDNTAALAAQNGASVMNFHWNGQYPKKKQWALDNLPLKHDWVLMLDADERLTSELCAEIASLFDGNAAPDADGYFITGLYRIGDKILNYGQKNRKLMLMNRQKLVFPVVDDLAFEGGWEVEGHYQPVAKAGAVRIGVLHAPLIHDAFDDRAALKKRHAAYAQWEARMNIEDTWPQDVVPQRERLKRIFRALPCRHRVMFVYSYIIKCGFLDGRLGFAFAQQRALYYKDIAVCTRAIQHKGDIPCNQKQV